MTDRTLVLLRHAKAERPADTRDMDRPLTARGLADSAAAGAWLADQGHLPDVVLCSPSRRTRQTWHAVAVALAGIAGGGPTVRYERAVYDGGAEAILELIQGCGDEVGSLLVIGHNPTISELSRLLDPTGTGDSDGLRTSGLAVHAVPEGWSRCESAPLVAVHTARG